MCITEYHSAMKKKKKSYSVTKKIMNIAIYDNMVGYEGIML